MTRRALVALLLAGCWTRPEPAGPVARTPDPVNETPRSVASERDHRTVWIGQYRCTQGVTGVRLTIDRRGTSLAATFEFGPLAERHPAPHHARPHHPSWMRDDRGHPGRLIPGRRRRMLANMPSVRIDSSTEIQYRVVGDGPIPVVLVHGWMTTGSVFDPILPLLSKQLRCIIPDHRGTGASTTNAEDESVERLGRDVIAVADAEGLTTFAVVGHSMGGQISQWIASEIPDRVTTLMVFNAVPASGAQLPPEAVALFSTSGGDRGKQGTILDLACKELKPHDRETLLDAAGRIAPSRITRMFNTWTQASFAERLSAIRARTLVLATDDPFLPPDFLRAAIADKIAGARLVVLPGPGHYPQFERPSETAAIVNNFLTAAS